MRVPSTSVDSNARPTFGETYTGLPRLGTRQSCPLAPKELGACALANLEVDHHLEGIAGPDAIDRLVESQPAAFTRAGALG
jgi:hypothetical protein